MDDLYDRLRERMRYEMRATFADEPLAAERAKDAVDKVVDQFREEQPKDGRDENEGSAG